MDDTCMKSTAVKTPRITKQTILQKKTSLRLHGFSCKMVRSTITEYCGSFGHGKLAEPPELEIATVQTPETCLNMVNTQIYYTVDNRRVKLELNTENIIHENELGLIVVEDNKISCQGQQARINNHIVEDIFRIVQTRITLTRQTYNYERGRIEVVANHVELPSTCGLESAGCSTYDTTYVWEQPRSKCMYEEARTVQMEEEEGYLIDRTHKILLKRGDPIIPEGCPSQLAYATEYEDIYLTAPGGNFPSMSDDANIASFVKALDNYIVYDFEQKLSNQNSQLKGEICKQAIEEDNEKIIRIREDNHFLRRNGDVLEVFECKMLEGKIAEDKEDCYRDIPLQKGFVKPHNRLFTEISPKRPCNQHFGLKIKTKEGEWIEVNPGLKKIPVPEILPEQNNATFVHEDVSSGGIYTGVELENWRRHMQLGDLHESISQGITLGVCANEGSCPIPKGGVQYDLQKLQAKLTNLNPVHKVKEKINEWGAYLSAAVLLIEAFKFIVTATTIANHLLTDGVEGAKALIYTLCCGELIESQKIKRRQQRRRMQSTDTIETEVLPLQPTVSTVATAPTSKSTTNSAYVGDYWK